MVTVILSLKLTLLLPQMMKLLKNSGGDLLALSLKVWKQIFENDYYGFKRKAAFIRIQCLI